VALNQLQSWKPHLFFIDVGSKREMASALLPKIRLLTQEEYVPVVFVSSLMSLEEVEWGGALGVDDFLKKPLLVPDVVQKIRAMFKLKTLQDSLKRSHQRIDEVTSTDELTGLLTMKAAYRRAEEEVARSRRSRKPISAFLLNVDHFSDVNLQYGFSTGSSVLQEVALLLKQCLRGVDLLARVGADEFFGVMVETDLAEAARVAERIRDFLQKTAFKSQKQFINLTATIGVAGLSPDQTDQRIGDLLHITIEALKSAKANGSNRIEVYSFT
jgi:two-component system cell cycle response regulator